MSSREALTAVALAALLVASAVFGPAALASPAAAQSDDSGLFEMSIREDCDGLTCSLGSWFVARNLPDFSAYSEDFRDEEPTVDVVSNNLTSFVNANNQSLLNHSNDVLDHYGATVRNTTYVLELTVENEEDDTTNRATRYFVATADGSNVTSLEATDSTNETVDRTHTLEWNQVEELNTDIRTYHSEYVETGEIPSKTYLGKMVARYDITEITTGEDS